MPRFFVDIEARFAKFQDSLDKIQRDTQSAARSIEADFSRVNRILGAVGAGLSVGAVTAWAAAVIKETKEAEQASNRLNAVLRATGGIAGVNRAELDAMAESLSKATQFDDEGIRNAQAQLLKFDNISRDTFERALKLSSDLAAFMGTDVVEAVQAIGKGMQSPKEGLGALERKIGAIDPAIKRLIETNTENNRTFEAQSLLLDQVEQKIGGTAAAMNTGLTKATADLSKAWGDLNKAMGGAGKSPAVSAMEAVTRELNLWKRVIESGDWTDKLLAIMGAPSRILLQNQNAAPDLGPEGLRQSVSGRIRPNIPGLSDIEGFESALAAADAPPKFKSPEEFAAFAKRREEEEARDRLQQLIELADARGRAADEFAAVGTQITEAERRAGDLSDRAMEGDHSFFGDTFDPESVDRLKAAREAANRAFIESAEIEQQRIDGLVFSYDKLGNRIELTREQFEQLAEQEKTAASVGRELGFTFQSAFEDAIIEGEKFRNVLDAIVKDIARIILRLTVTQPIAEGIAGWATGIDWGGIFGGGGGGGAGTLDFSGHFAGGGRPPVGQIAMVGERGPELFVPDSAGTIIPNHKLGGGTAVSMNYAIDARGADAGAVARLEASLEAHKRSVVPQVLDAIRRGGSAHQVVRA